MKLCCRRITISHFLFGYQPILRPLLHPGLIRRVKSSRRRTAVVQRTCVTAALVGRPENRAEVEPHVRVRRAQRDRDCRQSLPHRPGVNIAIGPVIAARHQGAVVAGWQFLFERQSAPFKTISIIIQVPPFLQSRLRTNRPPSLPRSWASARKGRNFQGFLQFERPIGCWASGSLASSAIPAPRRHAHRSADSRGPESGR
jgi:hypothetical protein